MKRMTFCSRARVLFVCEVKSLLFVVEDENACMKCVSSMVGVGNPFPSPSTLVDTMSYM